MKKVIGFAMALAIMSVAGSISAAVTYTYSGQGASGRWTDPANWTASDGSTSGYPGVEITDIAVFPKDAGPVAFDFGKTELTIGELNVMGGCVWRNGRDYSQERHDDGCLKANIRGWHLRQVVRQHLADGRQLVHVRPRNQRDFCSRQRVRLYLRT